MGRPIQKKWFGPAAVPGNQIVVNGVRWADNSTATGAYIVNQIGTSYYTVSNGTKTEPAFMVNANGVGALQPGQCFITATPFGGSPLPCSTIAQYTVTLFTVPNSVARPVGVGEFDVVVKYRWSLIPATSAGQCNLNLS